LYDLQSVEGRNKKQLSITLFLQRKEKRLEIFEHCFFSGTVGG
jgi:hypothetical protein